MNKFILTLALLTSVALNIYLLWPIFSFNNNFNSDDRSSVSSPITNKPLTHSGQTQQTLSVFENEPKQMKGAKLFRNSNTQQTEVDYSPLILQLIAHLKTRDLSNAQSEIDILLKQFQFSERAIVRAVSTTIENNSHEKQFMIRDSLLKLLPYEPSLLMQVAHSHLQKGEFSKGSELMFFAYEYTNTSNEKATIKKQVMEQVKKRHLELIKLGQWQNALDMIHRSILIEPGWPDLYILKAESLYVLGRLEEAIAVAAEWVNSEQFGSYAKTIISKSENRLSHQGYIPLTKIGQHFLVEGQFNSQGAAQLMIDTGATISVLTQAAFDRLISNVDFRFVEYRTFNTANGSAQAPVYEAQHFKIDNYIVNNFKVAVMQFDSGQYDGLLGMNFMRNFTFKLNQTDGFLELSYQ